MRRGFGVAAAASLIVVLAACGRSEREPQSPRAADSGSTRPALDGSRREADIAPRVSAAPTAPSADAGPGHVLAPGIERARELAAERWGGRGQDASRPSSGMGLVRSVEPLSSDHLEVYLAGALAYRVLVGNPRAAIAGRPTFPYALVIDRERATFLEDDRDVARFLGSRAVRVTEPEGLRVLIDAFAALRGYDVQCDPSRGESSDGGGEPARWPLVLATDRDEWSAECALLVDPNIRLVYRYRFVLDAQHVNVVVERGAVLSRWGGYR